MDSALAFVLRRVPAFRGLDEAKQMCTVAILRYISIVGLLAASSASMLQVSYLDVRAAACVCRLAMDGLPHDSYVAGATRACTLSLSLEQPLVR